MIFDDKTVPRNDLNIVNKQKSNPLPWNGQFSPQLVETLMSSYCNRNDIVFDPFLGSGTTLLEAGEFNLKAYGTEINYGAICLANLYTFINIEFSDRVLILSNLEKKLNLTEDKSKDFFYTISKNITTDYEQKLFSALVVLTDFYKDNFSAKWLSSKWNKVKETVLALPFSKNKIEVMRNDARSLDINTDTCTFVLTSPPYINVFNYHQQYRASVEFLNGSVLPAAQAEIGSNRKNRGNRYLTVVQYCEDMVNVFSEINRVCKKDSHIIFVVGRESAVMKTPFYNGKIITELACGVCGLKPLFRQERNFKNKFGTQIYEDILHFSSSKINENIDYLKNFVLNLLLESFDYAPEDKKVYLRMALDSCKTKIYKIPIFKTVNLEVINA
ncbi:DNA methyltransferase [Treponema sp. Marseille-Q4130]|uniref:DNA methyltransferase n=1 Tax=Treponema sp. Marseille-Q4130 TaxID=2766702 RepID=UPI0016523784|nr:DNA methyltransferase [Treponema sp. Marseille-Q4130]MBC6720043.1 methyltransferase [Treponema sp. Marseille-Q4130]